MLNEIQIFRGNPYPLGLSLQEDTLNFALFSSHASRVTLGLFSEGRLLKELSLNQSGPVWHLGIKNLPEGLDYAYRCEGPTEMYYNPGAWLTDPYAKIVRKGRCKIAFPSKFDWQNDTPPRIPLHHLVIYELHVRGFTRHPSSGVVQPGTYLGLREKLPFLKKLGINAVELMPIFETDPFHCKNINPLTNEKLVNYWGYDPFQLFAPKEWLCHTDPIEEFKSLVRDCHKQGIEVFLDVVYNHSGESKDKTFYVNYRGIDTPVYFHFNEKDQYLDYTGCGNTLNTNHPVVQQLILDSLHYWVQEMHIDGFRFDLASIFTRDLNGTPLSYSPILEAIRNDPLLTGIKLIAEPWDAAGLYQVGHFPKWGPWSEWNGRYRDVARRFVNGFPNQAKCFADRLMGSPLLYKTPVSSINYITCHDGFTLRDLVSYQKKYNLANGEENLDGSDENDSWNCGVEGPTDDPQLNDLREKQMRNFFVALLISQGIPMLSMGDIYGHTQQGNNNPYVQDNELSWFDWDLMKQNQHISYFVSCLIHFRKTHPSLQMERFLNPQEIDWHSTIPFQPDWSEDSHFVAFTLKIGKPVYAAFNSSSRTELVTLPPGSWRKIIDTEEEWIFHEHGPVLPSQIEMQPHSCCLLAIDVS